MYQISLKSDVFFTEKWRFNDFQNGGRRPCWYLKICSFWFLSCGLCRHAVLLPRTKFAQNRKIGRWVMAKKAIFNMAAAAMSNFKNFNFWSRSCHRVRYLQWCTKFHQNLTFFFTEIRRFNDFQNGGRPPCWILKKIAVFVTWPFFACRLSSYNILLKSDNRLMSCGDACDFQDGGRRRLEF